MKAFMVISWLNRCRRSLKVPSTYQDLAQARCYSCWSVANIRCLQRQTCMSPRRNPSGMWSSSTLKLRSVGSCGLRHCWCRLATWAMHSGFGKHGQVTSVKSSKRTSSTMAAAGLKISTAALGLTFAVMLAANVVPTSAARLWAFESKWNEPDGSIILALHGFNW